MKMCVKVLYQNLRALFVLKGFSFIILTSILVNIGQLRGQVSIVAEPSTNIVNESGSWALVIHGGAGGPVRGTMSPQQEQEYTDQLNLVLQTGANLLRKGASSLDVVEACIKIMEDSPLFNAGKGAVLNEEGQAELDASIMDGKSLMAGAVASVKSIKNPISAARAVMEKTNHVLLIGLGADKFAKDAGLQIVDQQYFITPERKAQWDKMMKGRSESPKQDSEKRGTVGVVVLDVNGNVAAGTSTGGMMGKMKGRVGDSPIIGAGTYANNSTCAVSATGHGEFFIRNVVAYDLSALMEYKGMSLEEASRYIIMEKLKSIGGEGGLIAIDKNGNIAMPFNTNAMFRGYIKSDGNKEVSIY